MQLTIMGMVLFAKNNLFFSGIMKRVFRPEIVNRIIDLWKSKNQTQQYNNMLLVFIHVMLFQKGCGLITECYVPFPGFPTPCNNCCD